MIKVDGLTKRFGDNLAISDLTFEVERGEVLGFLGPNGAGKSTTMRILTCFHPPTAGKAEVGGHDVVLEPQAVRRRIGYLPESNPLYTEMKVREYLAYRAGLKGVSRPERVQVVGGMMERCGLGEVERKVIGHLSRGYRQRVGFADALLHDPDLLILDEPTVGLDPNQIKQVREMIRDLSKKRTVILSTHILQEVEAVCNRIIIIDRGKIVLQDTLASLKEGLDASARIRAEIGSARGDVGETLRKIPGVTRVSEEAGDPFGVFTLEAAEGKDLREAVYRKAVEEGWALRELRKEVRTLEEIFMEITFERRAG